MQYEDTILQQFAIIGACLRKTYRELGQKEPDWDRVRKFITLGTASTVKLEHTIKELRQKKNPGV